MKNHFAICTITQKSETIRIGSQDIWNQHQQKNREHELKTQVLNRCAVRFPFFFVHELIEA